MDTLPLDMANDILLFLTYGDIDKLSRSNKEWTRITHESLSRHRASIIISSVWRQYYQRTIYELYDYEEDEEDDPYQCPCGCGLDPTECAINYLKYEQRYVY